MHQRLWNIVSHMYVKSQAMIEPARLLKKLCKKLF